MQIELQDKPRGPPSNYMACSESVLNGTATRVASWVSSEGQPVPELQAHKLPEEGQLHENRDSPLLCAVLVLGAWSPTCTLQVLRPHELNE